MPKRPYYLRSPINVPEGRVGNFSIEHDEFKPGLVQVIDIREAMLTGRRPLSARIRKPLKVHRLVEEGRGVWMSDEPRELRQAGEWIQSTGPSGRVLVGGLGLGVVATWLTRLPLVDSVDVVEIRPEVVSLVSKWQCGYDTYITSIFDFVQNAKRWDWDTVFLDIWQGTSESTWWTTVMPLRRAIANKFGSKNIHCWAEDMMMGQIARAIHSGNASTQRALKELRPEMKIDGKSQRHWYYEHLPEEMTTSDTTHLLTRVGLPDWEKRWGDKIFQEESDGQG